MKRKSIPNFLALTLLALLAGRPLNAMLISQSSSQIFYIDKAVGPQLPQALLANYYSYLITNDTGPDYPDIWVSIGGFSGGYIDLAPNEDGLMHLGSLATRQARTAFFYLQGISATAFPQAYTISVYDGPPPRPALATQALAFTDVEVPNYAANNQVNVVVSGPN